MSTSHIFFPKNVEMSLSKVRDCPICGGRPIGTSFPYATCFTAKHFGYLKCGKCKSVFVDPVPDTQTFAQMYSKPVYHDLYYDGDEGSEYSQSVLLLGQYLEPSAIVLDYGCGLGNFLKALRGKRLVPFGVEFDSEAALFAAKNANCKVMTVDAFSNFANTSTFDAIHIGDVLEHLPDPSGTLSQLLKYLKPGGVLFVEGPLEENPSPVFWAVWIFGIAKRLLKPTFISNDPPTHLFRTNAQSQKAFFTQIDKSLNMRHWQVYETGWPYKSGGFLKQTIAAFASCIGGRRFKGVTFGNRFKAILVKQR